MKLFTEVINSFMTETVIIYDNGLRHVIINNIFDWVLSYTFNMNKPSMT